MIYNCNYQQLYVNSDNLNNIVCIIKLFDFDIIELLSDKTVKQWEALYNNNEDAFNYEEGEE